MYIPQLTTFFNSIATDHRVGTTHISLYITLFQYWNLNCFEGPVSIAAADVMKIAKINGRATYHKCMRELHQYGYIRYVPSFDPALKSLVYLK